MGDLGEFLQTAALEPMGQVSAGQIPIAPKLLLVPKGESPGELHTKLLEVTSALFIATAIDVVDKKAYNQLGTATQVVEALNSVTNTAYDKFTTGFSSMLQIGPAPRIAINRSVPRADLHREIVNVLFEGVVGTTTSVLHELDDQLTRFVGALSTLPTDIHDKDMGFFFFSSQVTRENIGGPSNPFYLETPLIKMHLVRMNSEVYQELVKKEDDSSPKFEKTRQSSQATAHPATSKHPSSTHPEQVPLSWRDLLFGNQSRQKDEGEEEDPDEDSVTLRADYFIINGKLNASAFDQRRVQLDSFLDGVTGQSLKEYADQTTKVLFV
ncbi:hypothetical protein N7519_010273 [Penicillium mononematosum]|uniref:uncharacterized protein n=1 Tax=Penicillium mononematosum TaxID=268346 RepID=UPI0025478BD8|nr:uncharacterized protein N7519_010273 [Penicillium mononematosum]KAJ6179812.1 hypothetical protein N7519_010273 [Penicillium mononematosum]